MTFSNPQQTITLNLPSDLLQQVQAIAGTSEALNDFLVSAIAHEIDRHRQSLQANHFWENLESLRSQMQIEGIEIDPDEIWGDVRDLSPGREVNL